MLEKLLKKIEKLEETIGGLTSGAAAPEPEVEPEPEPEPEGEDEGEGEPEEAEDPEVETIIIEDEDYLPIHMLLTTMVMQRDKLKKLASQFESLRTSVLFELFAADMDSQERIKELKEKLDLLEDDGWALLVPDDQHPHARFVRPPPEVTEEGE